MYNKKEFLYGAAYYYEYQLPESITGLTRRERMRKDFSMMRKSGMNLIRIAESTWSTIEPEEGVYYFGHIDAMLEEAQNARLKVIVGTPTYAIPPWMAKKYPKTMVDRKNGRALYGPRQSMDILNPDYRNLARLIIQALVSHVANNPIVIGYQIDNETKYYDNYSKYAQDKFLQYLMAKFKTVNVLNETYGLAYWSNSLTSWDDFPDIRGNINGGLGAEYQKFMRSQAVEFLSWEAQIVRRYARPDQFITHNLDHFWRVEGVRGSRAGYSYGVQPGIDHYEVSKFLDISGTDIYHPSQDQLTGREIAYCGDEIRCLKDDNYLVLETQAQGFWQWTPYTGQIFLQAISHIASGACAIEYWNWNSLHNSFETYWKGVLSHDLKENRIYQEISQTGIKISLLWPSLQGLRKNNKIAVIVSNMCQCAVDDWFRFDRNYTYNHAVMWIYNALYEQNLECDIVDAKKIEEHPEITKRYKLLITPVLYSSSDCLISILKKFVADGGVLVSTFKSFFADEHLTVRPDFQPYHMTDVFGVYYQEFTQPGKAKVEKKKAKYFAELLIPVKESDVKVLAYYEHSFWRDYASVTQNKFGAGTAFYIGTHVSKKVLKKYLSLAATIADISIPEDRWPIIIRSGINERGEKIHFVLHYSGKDEEWKVPWNGTELISREKVFKENILHLSPWDVKIVIEQLPSCN